MHYVHQYILLNRSLPILIQNLPNSKSKTRNYVLLHHGKRHQTMRELHKVDDSDPDKQGYLNALHHELEYLQ